jgi:hypothetical protein
MRQSFELGKHLQKRFVFPPLDIAIKVDASLSKHELDQNFQNTYNRRYLESLAVR